MLSTCVKHPKEQQEFYHIFAKTTTLSHNKCLAGTEHLIVKSR